LLTAGIICEYNPFHLGHRKQFGQIREALGQDTGIVCLMSGNYVQRGAPALFDKSRRAEAALRSGADLVLELPVTVSLSSAEGFAGGGVGILGKFCDYLAFGCETGNADSLNRMAEALLSPAFPEKLKEELARGISFPAARQAALEKLSLEASLLSMPNDILAVEYCKAILSQGSAIKPLPLCREGSYHSLLPDRENPSAAFLRERIRLGESFLEYVPEEAADCFPLSEIYTLEAGERAVLAKLRMMEESDFEALPYGSEGLWRRLMHACRENGSLEEILTAAKSKRYTRSRLDRMVMCAYLGITREILAAPVPYIRVLGFREKGREILSRAKKALPLRNAGSAGEGSYYQLEKRWEDLYGLFRVEGVTPPGAESRRRVVYLRADE